MNRRIKRPACFVLCLLVALARPSIVATVSEQSLLREVDALYREISGRLMAYKQVFGPSEVLLTFGILGDEPELQLQFAADVAAPCQIMIRYVPRNEDSIYQRLFAVVKAEPGISADKAATLFRLQEERRSIDCDGTLGRLLARFRELPMPIAAVDESRRVFIHALTYRIEVRSPDVQWFADVLSAADVPLAAWLNLVRREIIQIVQ